MATRYMVVTSGTATWNSTASWSTSDGGSSGASVPTTGDTAIINRGTATIPGGDFSATSLAALIVTAPVTMGSNGTPFKITLSNPGSAAIVCDISGDQGDLYLALIHAGSNCITRLSSTGNVFLSSATAAGEFVVASGNVTINSSFDGATWTLTQIGGNVRRDAGASTAPTLDIQAGTFSSASNVGATTIGTGATTYLTGTATASAITVNPFGTHYHQSSGTITTITVKNKGTASAAGASAPFTVTTSRVYGDGDLFTKATTSITYSSTPVQIWTGGGLSGE